MKKLLTVMVALGIWSLLPATAIATCDRVSAQIVRVLIIPGASTSFIYYRDNALSDFYWMCTTNDANLLNTALNAQDGLNKTYIRSDAAGCPDDPPTGQRSAGRCQIMIVNPINP